MYDILTLNSISESISSVLPKAYFNVSESCHNPHGIIVRSSVLQERDIKESLLAVARAGAGVNNIPVELCTKKGIAVFNTPGANANAVMELVLCSMIMASRNVKESISWVNTLSKNDNISATVEKGKKQFKGSELKGKTLGIIGLGAVGTLVAKVGAFLQIKVLGFDPYLSKAESESLSQYVEILENENELIKESDIISFHIPLTKETKGKIDEDFVSKCKNEVILMNFSRSEISDTAPIINGLNQGKIKKYVCDFPTSDLLNTKNVILTPHLASGTFEAQENCALMAGKEISDYILFGNVKNSVNFPQCFLKEPISKERICVLSHAKANAFEKAKKLLTFSGINVEKSAFCENENVSYMLFDTDKNADEKLIFDLEHTKGVIKVRVIN